MSMKLKMVVTSAIMALSVASFASAAPKKAAGKSAASTAALTTTCPVLPSTTVFSQWGDLNPYFLAPGGSMEDTTLWPGGSFIADNNPFKLSGAGTTSLRLLDGKAATSPWVCQGSTYPTMRFMVRNVGNPAAKLNVVMYKSGVPIAVNIGTITAGSAWGPSPIITLPTGLLPDGVTIPKIQVAFVATGVGADFRIDDLFIDPRSRG